MVKESEQQNDVKSVARDIKIVNGFLSFTRIIPNGLDNL